MIEKSANTNTGDKNSRPTDVSRRQFLGRSASAIVATSAAGVVGVASTASSQDKTSDVVDTSARWNAKPGDLYTVSEGYSDEDIRGWRGRTVYGVSIGVIQLEAQIPMPPGDMGNATTFPFPLLYERLGKIDPNWVVSSEPHPEVTKRSIAAAKRLEMQGVRAIVGNCGFFANYQPQVAKEISVPFFSSSLMQIPMIMASIRPDQVVGVMTANGATLKSAPALKYSGVTDMARVVIYGAEHGENMKKILSNSDNYNMKGLEQELVALAQKMVREHPEVGAVVLECTEFPPHAFAIQKAIRRNVWDFTTLVNWMHYGSVRRSFTGWM